MTAFTTELDRAIQRTQTRQLVAFLTLTLPTATVRFGSRATMSGGPCEPLLLSASVSRRTPFLSGEVNLASAAFEVADSPLSLPGNPRLSDLLGEGEAVGAPVVIVMCEESLDYATHAAQMFVGNVQTYDTGGGVVTFSALESSSWNRAAAVKRVTLKENPHALEDVVGQPIPSVLGRVMGAPARLPHDKEYGDVYRILELLGGTRARVGQSVVVDAGRGNPGDPSTRAKVVVAAHATKQFGNFSPLWGTSPWLEGGDGKLHTLDPLSSDVFNSDAAGTGFYWPDGTAVAYCPVLPVSNEVTTNYAENPHALIAPDAEYTFATFDYTAGKRRAWLRCPPGTDLGQIQHGNVLVYVVFRGGPTLAKLNLYLRDTVSGVSTLVATLGPSAGFVPTWAGWAVNLPSLLTPDWDFGRLRFDFEFDTVGAAGVCDVYRVGMAVGYTPRRDVLFAQKRTVTTERRVRRLRTFLGWVSGKDYYTVHESREVEDNVTEVRGRFFANALGQMDPDGATTGTVGALVERLPDLLRWTLTQYAGVSPGDIVDGAGEFGSFTDARSALVTRSGLPMVGGCVIDEDVTAGGLLRRFAEAAGAEVQFGPDGRWRLLPWDVAPALTYLRPVRWADILDPNEGISVSRTPSSNALAGLRLPYDHDAATGSFRSEVAVRPGGSSSGYANRNIRDASLEVYNVGGKSNRLVDWVGSGSGVHQPALGLGDHTPEAFVGVLDAAFTVAGVDRSVALGGVVVFGVNDRLPFKDASVGGDKTAILTPGAMTMQERAADAQAAMNALSSGWAVAYIPQTKRFEFKRSGGTAGVLRWSAFRTASSASLFGFDFQTEPNALAGTVASTYLVPADTVSVALSEEFDLLWQSGAASPSGTNASAADVLGFDSTHDVLGRGRGLRRHHGWSPKSDLEKLFASSVAKYGERRDLVVELRAVYDTATALALRDRLARLLTVSRGVVQFSTDSHAGLRRGDVFEFSSDVDARARYAVPGTGGAFSGRRFRVVETMQRFVKSWHTEVVAVDVTD